MRLRLFLFLVCILYGFTGNAFASDKKIALITWRGLTPAEEGFKSRLAELGIEAEYEHFDADRDHTKLAGYIRERLEDLKSKDLIYTFGTTATLAVQNFDLMDVPHVFSVVSDPVGVGLASTLDTPNQGVTGTKLNLPVEETLRLIDRLLPYQSIAILFDPREENAVAQLKDVSEAASSIGKTPISIRFVPDGDETQKQIKAIKPQIREADIVYITATSSYVAQPETLTEIIPNDLVSYAASSPLVEKGSTLSIGTEYFERGEATADIAAQILTQDVHPEDIPIDELKPDEALIFVNQHSPAAKKLQLQNTTNKIEYR